MLRIAKQNKKLVLSVLWSVVAVTWLVLGGTFFLADNQTTAIIAITAAAIVTEVAFWLSALLLGLALVDARKALWHRLVRRERTS